MGGFADFCNGTSLHGWSFVPGKCHMKRLFWLIAIFCFILMTVYFLRDTITDFQAATIKVNVEDRAASLDDVYFPSVAVCNVNPISFIYWLQSGLKKEFDIDETESKLFKMIIREFFNTPVLSEPDPGNEEKDLLRKVLSSKFFKESFRSFMKVNNETQANISKSKVFLANDFDKQVENLPAYDEASASLFHQNYMQELASQWEVGQMIPYISWDGAKGDHQSGVFLKVGKGLSYGLCSWIFPFFEMPEPGRERDPLAWKKGALNGEHNGLSLMLDAETYDYGSRYYSTSQRAGEGFLVGLYHPHDLPIVAQTGVNIMPGARVLLSLSTTITNITENAVKRFSPAARKCWEQSEIRLESLPYSEGNRYAISNCLYEATMQEAHKNTSCYPGYMRPTPQPCLGKNLTDFNYQFSNLGMHRTVRDGDRWKECMAACRDQTYFTSESTAIYPARQVFEFTPSFCHVVKKLHHTCAADSRKKALEMSFGGLCSKVDLVVESSACEYLYSPEKVTLWSEQARAEFARDILAYTKQNIALVTIFMDKPYCKKIIQEIKFGWMQLIGNVGGILGLCLGGSFVSVVEIVWFSLRSITRLKCQKCPSQAPEVKSAEVLS